MIKTIKLENGNKEIVLNHTPGFKYLNLTSAKINNGTYLKPVPYIEMKLLNDRHTFTLYSNLLPGTDRLICYDLLSASSNIPALANEIFHTLKCIMPENVFDKDAEVEMEFEYA